MTAFDPKCEHMGVRESRIMDDVAMFLLILVNVCLRPKVNIIFLKLIELRQYIETPYLKYRKSIMI